MLITPYIILFLLDALPPTSGLITALRPSQKDSSEGIPWQFVAFALPSFFNSIYDAVKINAKCTNKSSLKSWHKFSLEVLSLKTRKVQFAASSFQEQQYLLPQIAEGSKCCKPKGSNSRLSQILHLLWVFFLLGWVLFLFLFVSWPPCQCMPVIWLYQSPLGFPGYNHFPRNWGSLNNKSRC